MNARPPLVLLSFACAAALATPAYVAASQAPSAEPSVSATPIVTATPAILATPIVTTPATPAPPMIDAACDPTETVYGDYVAVANDGTIFVGSIDCHEIWRFAPGAHGNVAPVGVLTSWQKSNFSIQALGTSGSHLLVGGFSSFGIFDEDATGTTAPLRYVGDGKDDTEAASGLQNSVGGPVGVYGESDGSIVVLENRAVHGYDGGLTVVQFAPGARGNVPAKNEFDPTTLAKPPIVIPPLGAGDNPEQAREGTTAIALGAEGKIYALDWLGNILVSHAHGAAPFRTIAHVRGSLTSLALDGRGRLLAGEIAAIHIIAGTERGMDRESIISGSKTTLATSKTNGRVGIRSLWTDDSGSIFAFECDGDRGRVLTFAPNAAGNVAPISVLGGPLTHIRC